jgi:hypothetical protein
MSWVTPFLRQPGRCNPFIPLARVTFFLSHIAAETPSQKKTQWHPTGAWSLSEPVEFANDPLALRQNEFKDFVILSAL